MVQERAAIGVAVQRPAGGVYDQARLVLRGIRLPQLLDADAVALRILALVQFVFRDQLAPQLAARALGEDRVFRMQFHAALVLVGRLAVLADAHVAGGHALDRAGLVVQHLRRGEAGEDFHAERLGLLRQPAGDCAEADDVVAFVVEALGQQPVRGGLRAGFIEEQELVLRHRLFQRRTTFLPIGEQLVQRLRVHDRARQDVRARLGAFFQHADREFAARFRRQLLEPDRERQTCRPRADGDDVVFHHVAFDVAHAGFLGWHWKGLIFGVCVARGKSASMAR